MIKKIIACADIHYKNNMNDIQQLTEVVENFLQQCRDVVEEVGNKDEVRIVIAGDIFEMKVEPSNECYLAANYFLNEVQKIAKTIIFNGNHDMLITNLEKVDSITTLTNIGNYENLIHLDSALEYTSGYYVDDNIVWCLYSSFNSFERPHIEQIKAEYPDHTLIGLIHTDVQGARSDCDYEIENGIDLNTFKGLDFVIAGHIHRYQVVKKRGIKVVYCSSLMQQHFGEAVSGHGFVLWDVEKKDHKFIETPNEHYGYYKFSIDDISDIENDMEIFINP